MTAPTHHSKITSGYWNRPDLYDNCPSCGSLKQKMSKTCFPCRQKIRRFVPPIQQPTDPSYKLIPLTQGKIAIVETSEYAKLMQEKWSARRKKGTNNFYALRNGKDANGNRCIIFMHREILCLAVGDPREGDHALHNTLDNRRFVNGKENLRIATDSEQQRNHHKRNTNSSGFKGVSFHKKTGMWRARINVDGKEKFLGLHRTKELAYSAYCDAAKIDHKNFACLT